MQKWHNEHLQILAWKGVRINRTDWWGDSPLNSANLHWHTAAVSCIHGNSCHNKERWERLINFIAITDNNTIYIVAFSSIAEWQQLLSKPLHCCAYWWIGLVLLPLAAVSIAIALRHCFPLCCLAVALPLPCRCHCHCLAVTSLLALLLPRHCCCHCHHCRWFIVAFLIFSFSLQLLLLSSYFMACCFWYIAGSRQVVLVGCQKIFHCKTVLCSKSIDGEHFYCQRFHISLSRRSYICMYEQDVSSCKSRYNSSVTP